MKKFSLSLLVVVLATTTLLISCGSETTVVDEDKKIAENQNALEDNKIDVSLLEKGITIEGAKKLMGVPPSPNGVLDFKLNKSGGSAIQKTGFNISFSSDDQIAGAYIRFKDVDDNATSDFFDVPNSYFVSSKQTSVTMFNGVTKKDNKFFKNDLEDTINVKLNSTIPAGEFCYEICLYDADNNISSIETVCIVVEAWGGNADVVGEWFLDRIDEGVTEVNCYSGDIVEVSEYIKVRNGEESFIRLGKDGTYNDLIKDESALLNVIQTSIDCEVSYTDYVKREQEREGNWAYNEEDNKLIISVFKFRDLLNSSNTEEYDFGEELYNDITIKKLTDTELILEESDQSENFTVTYYFKRK